MVEILKKLYAINILSPKGLFYLIKSLILEGGNMMALLRFSAYLNKNRIAITDLDCSLSYGELLHESKKLAYILKEKFDLQPKKRVVILCRNHLVTIESLYALSRLGADIYLLNIEMSSDQLKRIIDNKKFDLIIYDEEKKEDLVDVDPLKCILTYHDKRQSISGLVKNWKGKQIKLKSYRSGKIAVLTGGTSGEFKTATRKPSLTTFMSPLFALLCQVHIDRHKSVYVATPIYHSYGLAAVIVSVLTGKNMFILNRYKTEDACNLIRKNNIEVAIVVPLMLQRMIKHDETSLKSLNCIITGGAPLKENLCTLVLERLGPILYNLYGTSEAGFAILATPSELQRHPSTIGKPIMGVSIRLAHSDNDKSRTTNIGNLTVKCRWVMDSMKDQWVDTGDLAYVNDEGLIFLHGRADEMIVSGGENVFPEDLERELIKHESIEDVAVIGISDPEFGQRLKAFVVLKGHATLTESDIKEWLSSKVARYQLPAQIIIIDKIPLTSIGKANKNQLVSLSNFKK